MSQAAAPAELNHRRPIQLLAIGHLALIIGTWPLWIPQTVFPQVPLTAIAESAPAFVEWLLLAGLLSAIGAMLFARQTVVLRGACLAMCLTTLALASIDQHRLQPWAWQFSILSLVLAVADTATALSCWRWLILGIYLWSSWSKISDEFGLFLIEGLFQAIGLPKATLFWSESVRRGVAIAVPCFEFVVAFLLAFRPTRLWGTILSTVMHSLLMLALGPFGYGHRPGVLIWNTFFIVQNWCLFCRWPTEPTINPSISLGTRIRSGNRLARLTVWLAMIWPALRVVGMCDNWIAWAVYAQLPVTTQILIHTDELEKLPSSVRQYVEPQSALNEWHPLRIDRWSLDAVYAPIYPQDRFYVGAALGLARRFDLNRIHVQTVEIIKGGNNTQINRYFGIGSLTHRAQTFRVNALPRWQRLLPAAEQDEKHTPITSEKPGSRVDDAAAETTPDSP